MFHLHQGSKKLEIRTISVAFATDDNYLAPTLVAVKSIALHATNGYGYAIYILSDHPLGAINKKMFLSAVKNFGNVTITFIAVGHKLGSVRLSETGPAKGITAATYFRFLLPDLLQDMNKILYMDADTVVMDDVAKVFLYDVDGCYIGGVRDITGHQDAEARCRELEISDLHQYVNAGVLLLNLDELRKDGLPEKMLNLAVTRSFLYNDQDIINALCYGKIRTIPHNCNVIVDFLDNHHEISGVLGIDYICETREPIILHYAGRTKPWYHPAHPYTAPWWQVAKSFEGSSAVLFQYYLNRFLKKICKKKKAAFRNQLAR